MLDKIVLNNFEIQPWNSSIQDGAEWWHS